MNKELLSIVSFYGQETDTEVFLNDEGRNKKLDRAFVLLSSSAFDSIVDCLTEYGISRENAEEAIKKQWTRLAMRAETSSGSVLSEGRRYHVDGKPVFIEASTRTTLIALVNVALMALESKFNNCLFNEECISHLEELLND